LAMLSTKGRLLVIALEEIKHLSGGGRGTILMGVDAPDKLEQVVPVGSAGLRVTGIYRNKQAEDILAGPALAEYVSRRARKGKQIDVRPRQPILSPVL